MFTISGLSASDTFFFASDHGSGTDLTVEAAPLVAINAIDGNDIINFANAAAGVDISGTASDSSISVNNHSITVDIVNASNAVVDTYTSTISGGIWTVDVTTAQAQALSDGSYTVTAHVSDAAVDPATEATQTLRVDEDTDETPTLSFNDTLIGGPAGSGAESTAVHFTVGGLDASDDTAVITFTDVNGKTVTDTLSANGETTVNLSSLADGTDHGGAGGDRHRRQQLQRRQQQQCHAGPGYERDADAVVQRHADRRSGRQRGGVDRGALHGRRA